MTIRNEDVRYCWTTEVGAVPLRPFRHIHHLLPARIIPFKPINNPYSGLVHFRLTVPRLSILQGLPDILPKASLLKAKTWEAWKKLILARIASLSTVGCDGRKRCRMLRGASIFGKPITPPPPSNFGHRKTEMGVDIRSELLASLSSVWEAIWLCRPVNLPCQFA